MDNRNHTPGPWYLHHQSPDFVAGDCDWSLQTEKAGAFLLFCHHPEAPAKANARLIAAAPELFEALQRLVAAPYERDTLAGGSEYMEAHRCARVAIAKAILGEAP